MGDTQSVPVQPEGKAPEKSSAKPWSPDDATSSSDEEATASQTKTTSRIKSDPSFDQAQMLAESKTQHHKANKFESTRKRGSNGSVSDYSKVMAEDVTSPHVAEMSDNLETRPDDPSADPFAEPGAITDVAKREDSSSFIDDDRFLNGTVTGVDKDSPNGTAPKNSAGVMAKLHFPCPQADVYGCDKNFSSKQAAKQHAQSHTSPKPFTCPLCTKAYKQLDLLEKHRLSHDEARPNTVKQSNQAEEGLIHRTVDSENGRQGQKVNMREDSYPPQPLDPLREQQSNSQVVTMKDVAKTDQAHIPEPTLSFMARINPPLNTDVVQETPQPKSRLKRKRGGANGDQPAASSDKGSQKRRRRQSLSLPLSLPSDGNTESGARPETYTSKKLDSTGRMSQKKGNLDEFAKPWTPGSGLRHPIHNPKSPRPASVQVVIPRTSDAGPSDKRVESWRRSVQQPSRGLDEQTPLVRKQQRLTYTSLKGKGKADNNTEYSSPPKQHTTEDDVDEDDDGTFEPEGMATSFARRTTGKKLDGTRSGSQSIPARSQASSTATSHVREGVRDNDDGKEGKTSQDHSYACSECGRNFKNRNSLRIHEKLPHLRPMMHECDECDERFKSTEDLRTHQQAAEHGDGTGQLGRKGAFSDREVRKLQTWKDDFCEQYDINTSTFNQMMTDSSRRSKGFQWPYRFIAKSAFLQEYYDLLPDRNRRSMHRYRERAFQNVPEKQEWTKEDDEELIRLVREIGPKWVEIGQMMTRTQDSVNQRWRHKLQYNKGKVHQGEWLTVEEEQLKAIVAEVRRESKMSLDPNADIRIPWDTVSKRLKGKRTAQQCSNKWRLMHFKREGNKFVKPTDIDCKIGTPSSMATPSKMSQRLAGQTPSTTKSRVASQNKYPSDEYVRESEEAEEAHLENQDDVREDKPNQEPKTALSSESLGKSENNPALEGNHDDVSSEDEAEPPPKPHNPLPSRTPRQGVSLSQAFAQTQANTSALRAPTTIRRPHTQTEMPTPGIPMQLRPSSSPLRMISVSDRATNRTRASSQDEDAIMADPKSSDEDTQSLANSNESTREGTPASSQADGRDGTRGASPAKSITDSITSTESSSSEGEESVIDDVEDSMVQGTQRDSFMRSLRSSSGDDRSLFTFTKPAGSIASRGGGTGKIDWNKLVNGINGGENATDSDTDDEGDIMHH